MCIGDCILPSVGLCEFIILLSVRVLLFSSFFDTESNAKIYCIMMTD